MKSSKINVRDFSLFIAIVLIWAFFTWRIPDFLSPRNLSMLSIELSTTAVASLGMLLIILLAHIDLSVGSAIGLTGGIASVLIFQHQWSAPAAMLVALLVGITLYTIMGFIIARERIPAFIITLGGLLIFKGVFWKVIGNQTIPVKAGEKDNLLSILTTYYLPAWAGWSLVALIIVALVAMRIYSRAKRRSYGFEVESGELMFSKLFVTSQALILAVIVLGRFRGVPLSLTVLGAVAFIIWIITNHTRFGRYLYAIGGNEEAAIISGIPVRAVTIGAFVIAGITATITGFMQTAYSGASTTTTGELMELDAIASCVIGGTALAGGRGTVAGVLAGAFLIDSLMNGMTLMAVSPEMKFVTRGLVLTLAVWLDVRLSRRGS
ncbi:MAG: ATPase [Chthoniobacteraceae bacterium]